MIIASGFLAHQWRYPSSLYDAAQYGRMGRDILEHGLATQFMGTSQVRTYGYPLFLSLVQFAADTLRLPAVLPLFAAQFGGYVAACILFRNALMLLSPPTARAAFCGLLLNYYALVYTPEQLTESLSLTILIVLAAGWLHAYRRHGPLWLLAVLSALAGLAIEIRPANLAVAGAWVVGMAIIVLRTRRRRWLLTGTTVAVCLSLPLIPQLAYNVRWFGRWTPLVAVDLGRRQQAWGIQFIKYATAMPPNPDAAIPYLNPWLRDTELDVDAPLRWYAAHPRRGALTIALHTFNLTDQDLLFTYSHDLDPWYRVPLGIVNHTTVVLGFIGLAIGGYRMMRRRPSRIAGDAMALVLLLMAATWAMLAWTAIEIRFGLTVLGILFPAAVWALGLLLRSRRVTLMAAVGVIVVAYVAGALRLSTWVRAQAPAIQAALARRAPGGDRGDKDGDGVVDSVDRCPTLYAASPDGCPVAAPRSGVWAGGASPELLFVNRVDGSAHAWQMTSGVETGVSRLWHASDLGWRVAGTSDLTGDGKADLLWQSDQTGAVRLFRMDGIARGAEQAAGPAVGDSNWIIAGTGDFDNDGHADVVWEHRKTGYVVIWFMGAADGQAVLRGTGYVTRDAGAATLGPEGWRVAGTTDFDADGCRDLVLQQAATGELKIWGLGARAAAGVPLIHETPVGTVSPDWRLGAITDYSGDGHDDLVFQSRSTLRLFVWVRNANGFEAADLSSYPPAGWELSGPR